MDFSKLQYFMLFLVFLLIAQSLSILGQFVTLPYKNLTMWQAYTMALPFAWLDWMFLPVSVHIGTKYEVVNPNHIIFFVILIQFTLTLLVNRFYMKKQTTISDWISFIFIFIGFLFSYFNLLSKFFGWKIPETIKKNKKDKKDKKDKKKKNKKEKKLLMEQEIYDEETI